MYTPLYIAVLLFILSSYQLHTFFTILFHIIFDRERFGEKLFPHVAYVRYMLLGVCIRCLDFTFPLSLAVFLVVRLIRPFFIVCIFFVLIDSTNLLLCRVHNHFRAILFEGVVTKFSAGYGCFVI